MKPFVTVCSFMILAVSAWAAKPTDYLRGPKNMVSPTYRGLATRPAVPHELTKKEVKRLTANAELAADHLKLARYYTGKAEWLEAKGAAYAEAATKLRHGPFVKNFMAPTTPGRFEFLAKGFREEAKSDRALAASHDQMATDASAGF